MEMDVRRGVEDPSFRRTMLNTFSNRGVSPGRLMMTTRFPPYTPFSVNVPTPFSVPVIVTAT